MPSPPLPPPLVYLFILILCIYPVLCSFLFQSPNSCSWPGRNRILRRDQMTVMINGYAESRIPLLTSIASSYSSSPLVASVLVLWSNLNTTSETLTRFSDILAKSASVGAPITLIRQRSESLNSRFLPYPFITTAAVLVSDDDVEIDIESIEFAFRVWISYPNRLVGFFARSHQMDLTKREWIYTVHPDKYSIVLTKCMIMKSEYLNLYSCGGGWVMDEMRGVVDRELNCEDILMNFVVAEEIGAGPILVGGGRVRDWGDGRTMEERGEKVRGVGLSRRRSHRMRRGECIGEFHRLSGKMPLRYSHGKFINSLGELFL